MGGFSLLSWLVVLQFSCSWIIVAMITFGQCQVSYDFSGKNSFVKGKLLCLGDCQFSADGSSARLPPQGNTSFDGTAGRLMYPTPIPLYNSSSGTGASFSTQFVFTVVTDTNRSYVEPADGFTFLIAPSAGVPPNSRGGALGLFKNKYPSGDPDDGTTNLVAVEFDTFAREPNVWDPAYFPHVGLDLNSLKSSAVSPKDAPVVRDIIGNTVGVWIDYSAAKQYLQVDMALIKQGQPPAHWTRNTVLTYSSFNLSAFVQEESYVGFSASTGLGSQLSTVTYWKFQTSFDEVIGI